MIEAEVKPKSALADVYNDNDIVGEDASEQRRRRKRIQIALKCPLCEGGVKDLTYKDVYQLKKFTSVRGKIIGRDKSGMCAKHQRQLSTAIKRARYMALLPAVSITRQ